MIAYNVTPEQIRAAAREVGVRLRDRSTMGGASGDVRPRGRGWRFQLATDADEHRTASGRIRRGARIKYARVGRPDYRTGKARAIPAAVCWHGHRDFFRALYRAAPDARVVTAMATYTGAEHFEATFPESDRNIGSLYAPLMASEACRCADGEWTR